MLAKKWLAGAPSAGGELMGQVSRRVISSIGDVLLSLDDHGAEKLVIAAVAARNADAGALHLMRARFPADLLRNLDHPHHRRDGDGVRAQDAAGWVDRDLAAQAEAAVPHLGDRFSELGEP